MRRREFIRLVCCAAPAWPAAVSAQRKNKIPRVGVLSPGHAPPNDPFRQAEHFETGLRSLGWQPGTTIQIEYRYAEGRLDRLPTMAAELVRMPVDVIIARGQTVAAARDATSTIGIVMAADPDPVGNGFIKSMARPGGNISGFSTQAFELEAKQLELLHQVVPSLTRVAVLTSGRSVAVSREQIERRQAAARTLQIELIEVSISESAQIDEAFVKIGAARAGAVLISGTLWFIDSKAVSARAIGQRLPTVTNLREFANAGVLMTYGVSFPAIHRRSAVFVDKIIKGINPAEIPVEQPMKFDFVINLKTAQSLGLTVPQTLLVFADEVVK